MKNKKIVAITSAREHSRRLYRKELNELGGKYVIEWTLEQMANCNLFDVRIMTTDWVELINLMLDKYPTINFEGRSNSLAKDDTPAQDYISDTLEEYPPDKYIYCLLQSTSPLREMWLIYRTYQLFEEKYNCLFTVNKYTLETDGQIYWFRDPNDIFKKPGLPYLCEPSVDLDYPYNLRIAEYLVKSKNKKWNFDGVWDKEYEVNR